MRHTGAVDGSATAGAGSPEVPAEPDHPSRPRRHGGRLPGCRTTASTLLGLAVVVQAAVWGSAPASGSGGSLLPGLRAEFGIAYGVILLAAEVGVCLLYRVRNGVATVLVSAAAVDVVFWLAHLVGTHFRTGAAAALTAAFGALVLAAGLLSGRLVATRSP
jgi:hypothetical protein